MNKKLHIWIILLSLTSVLSAQKLTIEYQPGIGTFNMSGMKDILKNGLTNGLQGVKTTDNFPASFTQDIRLGIQFIGRHQAGILYAYQTTSGQNHLADYSGEYKLKIRNTGYKLGAFYRYFILDSKVSPFVELSTGVVICRSQLDEYFRVDMEQESYNTDLKGTNLFIQPAIGVRYRIMTRLAISASIGYECDSNGKLHLKDNRKAKTDYSLKWNGLRASAGITLFL